MPPMSTETFKGLPEDWYETQFVKTVLAQSVKHCKNMVETIHDCVQSFLNSLQFNDLRGISTILFNECFIMCLIIIGQIVSVLSYPLCLINKPKPDHYSVYQLTICHILTKFVDRYLSPRS